MSVRTGDVVGVSPVTCLSSSSRLSWSERARERSGFQTHYFYRIGSIFCRAVPKRRCSPLRRARPCQASPPAESRRVLEEWTIFGERLMWREAGESPWPLSWKTKICIFCFCPTYCRYVLFYKLGTVIQDQDKFGTPRWWRSTRGILDNATKSTCEYIIFRGFLATYYVITGKNYI